MFIIVHTYDRQTCLAASFHAQQSGCDRIVGAVSFLAKLSLKALHGLSEVLVVIVLDHGLTDGDPRGLYHDLLGEVPDDPCTLGSVVEYILNVAGGSNHLFPGRDGC